MEAITKTQAESLGQKWYFTGEPCQNGHIDKRYVNTGICYGCKREINTRCRKNNPDTHKAISKRKYLKEDKDKRNAQRREWCRKNPEKRKEALRKNQEKHGHKYLEREKARIKERRASDPYWRLSKNMSKAIWECLKNKKNQLRWLQFVDYTLDELISHLESKFKEDMSWENYGSYWHIDHVRPMSWFNLETEFKEAWALTNLQPLEGTINYSKCNRYEG